VEEENSNDIADSEGKDLEFRHWLEKMLSSNTVYGRGLELFISFISFASSIAFIAWTYVPSPD
jgi:hypothetical protein